MTKKQAAKRAKAQGGEPTPGPWSDVRVGREGDGTARSHEEQWCNLAGVAVLIVTHDGSPEARANAVLARSAPDLSKRIRELEEEIEARDDDVLEDLAACRICGCTEAAACEGGCSWVPGQGDLCSTCEEGVQLVVATVKGGAGIAPGVEVGWGVLLKRLLAAGGELSAGRIVGEALVRGLVGGTFSFVPQKRRRAKK